MPDSILFTCPACHTANRVPAAKAGMPARCGQCHGMLHTAGGGLPMAADSHSFPTLVLEAPIPVLVDLWAPWCGPCRALAPTLERLAAEYAGRLKVVKVNTDDNRELATHLNIQAIPTLILYDGGKIRNQISGALPTQQLRNWINRSMDWE